MSKPIVVVGAGLSGLICARKLHRAGVPVLVLDADDRPGGRMKTDLYHGFRLDRGFQVMFDAYPEARRELDFSRLDLRMYEPAALVAHGGKLHRIHRDHPLEMALSRFVRLSDKMRTLSLTQEVAEMTEEEIWQADDEATLDFLIRYGFSDDYLTKFLRPFWGGIFLDRDLQVSSRLFLFYWKMLNEGETVMPAQGIEAIPAQVAADLPAESLRMRTRVKEISGQNVMLESGQTIEADGVIVATDPREAARLTGAPTPPGVRSTVCLYFEAPVTPYMGQYLVLNGSGEGVVNHLAALTNVSPAMAPTGKTLICANVVGDPHLDDDSMAYEVKYELQRIFPKADTMHWKTVRIVHVPAAQMAQTPGTLDHLPSPVTAKPGVFLAGESIGFSSIEGAVRAGQRAADAVLTGMAQAIA